MMNVRVGRVVSSSHLSVQDLMSASVCLMISRTVNPEGPAAQPKSPVLLKWCLKSSCMPKEGTHQRAVQKHTNEEARGQERHAQQYSPTQLYQFQQ